MTFILKKIITCAIVPPGCFIVLLLIFAVFLKKKSRFFALLLAVLLYSGSIQPAGDLLLMPLEYAYRPPTLAEVKTGNAYVVLGGGVNDFAPDLDGEGTPGSEAFLRLICAYRLYRIDKKPIIISGGIIFERRSEAAIAKRILLSLGVNEKDILMEEKSKDTFENAKYVKELSDKHGINRIVLITSAFHMKRSMMLFNNFFKGTIPCPTGHSTSKTKYDLLSYLPNAGNLSAIAIAMKEYMGILFYTIFPIPNQR
ncbi:MAG: YdcF family protein [Proteobacteria bacterium]|nr:YdcF family protein [Pseudomonadota bacterium]